MYKTDGDNFYFLDQIMTPPEGTWAEAMKLEPGDIVYSILDVVRN